LILTLQSPFTPAKKRMKIYLASSLILCVPLTYLTKPSIDNIDQYEGNEYDYYYSKKVAAHLLLCSLLSMYILIALYSCIFASRRLDRKGINKVIRQKLLKKHYYYVGIFVIVWGAYLANAYYDLFYPDKRTSTEKKLVKYISKVSSVSLGLLLTFIRLGEPFFRYQVKKRFLYFFGIDVEEIELQKIEE
jgi:hypothetical protein